MKKSGKYVNYSILIGLTIVFFIASMCAYFAFGDRSMVSYILFGITGVTALIQVLAAVIYACRKDKDGLDALQVAYAVVALIILVTALCVPIFFIWIIERIHDAVSAKRSQEIL